jgi:periplasmic divalent cation tolerance protein
MPGARSFYRWSGAIESADEVLLVIKTSRELSGEVAAALQKAHSYQIPEVLALPVVDGSGSYLAWLGSNLKAEDIA